VANLSNMSEDFNPSLEFSGKRIKVKKMNKASLVTGLTILGMVLFTIYGLMTFEYDGIKFWHAIVQTLANFKVLFFTPHLTHFTFWQGVFQVLITVALAALTTLISAILAVFLGLLASQNLTSKRTSNVIKGIVALIRAVPEVLWVLIFAVSAGLGSVAAVIGMTFHSVGYLIKAYSESFEELEDGTIEALKASGANWWQIVFQAVIPSSITYLISWTFLRFEITFGVALAMGAAAGAGGIGYAVFMGSSFYFDLREIGAITFFILIFAVLLETIAVQLKRRLKVK